MKRSVLIFVALVVLALAGGLAVYHFGLSEDPPPAPVAPPAVPVEPPAAPAPAPDPVPQAPTTLVVAEATGQVERRGTDKAWIPVAVGDQLSQQEAIKTGRQSSAKLTLGEDSVIDVAERSELSVREITETVQRLELVRGKIGVDYSPTGARLLKIENTGSQAVAESRSGKFTVLNTNGRVSVATTAGEVKLTAHEETVVVGAGKISQVIGDRAPEEVKPIPVAVMLRVAKPKRQVQRERFTVVRGRTDPGARVQINDVPALVDLKGRFKARVPLKPGRNRLVVVTEDVAGNVKTRELPAIIVDANAPIDDINIRWKKKGEDG